MKKKLLISLMFLSLTLLMQAADNFYDLVAASPQNAATVFQELINGSSLVIVDFYAPWCPACRTVAPQFEKISQDTEYKNKVKFIKINYDNFPELCDTQNVLNLPHFGFYKNGIKVYAITGKKSEAEFRNAIQTHLQ